MSFSSKGIWDDRIFEAMRALADTQIYSAAQMAHLLSARFGITITRNALIGKCSRHGIALRGSKKSTLELPKVTTTPPKRRLMHPQAMKAPKAVKVSIPEPLPAGDVPDGCRWLHGEALKRIFCGAPIHSGSWCQHHAKRVWAPQPRTEYKPALKSRFAA